MEKTFFDIEKISTVLKLIGDKTRLTMVACLAKQDYCVCNFVDMFEMSQPAVSQHLKKLRDMGIVKETRKAQWIYYGLNTESEYYPLIKDMMKYIAVEENCCSSEQGCDFE